MARELSKEDKAKLFRDQTSTLLNPAESKAVKVALARFMKEKNPGALVENLEKQLNTPEKQILFDTIALFIPSKFVARYNDLAELKKTSSSSSSPNAKVPEPPQRTSSVKTAAAPQPPRRQPSTVLKSTSSSSDLEAEVEAEKRAEEQKRAVAAKEQERVRLQENVDRRRQEEDKARQRQQVEENARAAEARRAEETAKQNEIAAQEEKSQREEQERRAQEEATKQAQQQQQQQQQEEKEIERAQKEPKDVEDARQKQEQEQQQQQQQHATASTTPLDNDGGDPTATTTTTTNTDSNNTTEEADANKAAEEQKRKEFFEARKAAQMEKRRLREEKARLEEEEENNTLRRIVKDQFGSGQRKRVGTIMGKSGGVAEAMANLRRKSIAHSEPKISSLLGLVEENDSNENATGGQLRSKRSMTIIGKKNLVAERRRSHLMSIDRGSREKSLAEKLEEAEAAEGVKYKGKIVIYTTTVTPMIETKVACTSMRQIFQRLRVHFEEKNIYMSKTFAQELKERLPGKTVPQAFFNGQHLGDFEQILKMNEIEELQELTKHMAKHENLITGECQDCGGQGFIICPECGGDKKSRSMRFSGTRETHSLKCTACNENGLMICRSCISSSTVA